jgi:hypothetical protein
MHNSQTTFPLQGHQQVARIHQVNIVSMSVPYDLTPFPGHTSNRRSIHRLIAGHQVRGSGITMLIILVSIGKMIYCVNLKSQSCRYQIMHPLKKCKLL